MASRILCVLVAFCILFLTGCDSKVSVRVGPRDEQIAGGVITAAGAAVAVVNPPVGAGIIAVGVGTFAHGTVRADDEKKELEVRTAAAEAK